MLQQKFKIKKLSRYNIFIMLINILVKISSNVIVKQYDSVVVKTHNVIYKILKNIKNKRLISCI